MEVSEHAPQELVDDLVRAEAIQKEMTRISSEADALNERIQCSKDPAWLDVARLKVLDERSAELLAEMQAIHERCLPKLHALRDATRPPRRSRRRRLFSWLGLGKAALYIGATVTGFLTNPFLVLVTVLALTWHLGVVSG